MNKATFLTLIALLLAGAAAAVVFGRQGGRQSMAEAFAKQLIRTVASSAGREIMRGMLGGLSKSSRRR